MLVSNHSGQTLTVSFASDDGVKTDVSCWFIESLLTELVIALVVRRRGPFFDSRLGKLLLVSTLIVFGLTLVRAYAPFTFLFGFIPLPAPLLLTMLGLMALYMLVTEIAKKDFCSRLENAIA